MASHTIVQVCDLNSTKNFFAPFVNSSAVINPSSRSDFKSQVCRMYPVAYWSFEQWYGLDGFSSLASVFQFQEHFRDIMQV